MAYTLFAMRWQGPTKDRKGLVPPIRTFRHRKGLCLAYYALKRMFNDT